MKKTSLFLVLTFLFFTKLSAQDKEIYKSYHNERFDFCLQYPASFEAGIPPENGDGLSFHHKEKQSKILAFGALQMPEETLKSFFELVQKDIRVTYAALREKENYFIVSGLLPERGEIYYNKTHLKGGKFLTVLYEYPFQQVRYFDKVITESVSNFPNCP